MNTSHPRSGEHGPDILVVDTLGGFRPYLALLDDPYITFCGVGDFGALADLVCFDGMLALRQVSTEKRA
jgi:hypothetical protein